MQHRNNQNESHVIPVRHIDMRFLTARQCADVEQKISDPDNHQQNVGIPFWLCIFLRLRDADQIAGDSKQAEEIVADQHNPGAQLIRQTGTRGALHDMVRCCNQRVAAETENHARCVHRTQTTETCPSRIESHIGIGQQPRHPITDKHAKDRPEHGDDDAELRRVVIILSEAVRSGRGRVIAGDDSAHNDNGVGRDDEAMHTKRIALTCSGKNHP